MELFSAEFFSALLAIIIIDLVLAGDNAIVIALAARNLPDNLRKKAVIWGTVGAIAVRTAMTLVVVWLLKIPGLLLAGGALLVWIAYGLLVDENGGHKIDAASNFWAAMKTIVVADSVMGLDNVLAVAGAAHGSFLLVVLGLLISIPIVIWGSQLILKYVQQFPVIVYIGAGVLAWTAAKMMMEEPFLKGYFEQHALLSGLVYLAVIGSVLAAGFWFNHGKVRSRVLRHVVDFATPPAISPESAGTIVTGGKAMLKVLIPVDESPNSLKAVEYAVNRFMRGPAMEIHLLHVRKPFSRHIARFLGRSTRSAFHREQAEKSLAAARRMLEKSGVPYAAHMELGDDKARSIHNAARRLGASQILIGTAHENTIARILRDCDTNRLLEITQVPVEVVAGGSVPWLERIGIPAGVGAALALIVVAVD
jgi:YjbE family integral membrane protein